MTRKIIYIVIAIIVLLFTIINVKTLPDVLQFILSFISGFVISYNLYDIIKMK